VVYCMWCVTHTLKVIKKGLMKYAYYLALTKRSNKQEN